MLSGTHGDRFWSSRAVYCIRLANLLRAFLEWGMNVFSVSSSAAAIRVALVRWLSHMAPAEGRARTQAWGWVIVMLLSIAVLDWFSARDIILGALCTIPILFATLRLSLRDGMAVLLLSCALWFLLDFVLGRYEEGGLIWLTNNGIRFLMGLVASFLVAELHAALRREVALARTDALTGLANGRTFEAALDWVWHSSQRSGEPFTLAFLDLDRFKQVNDRHGHAAGDELLRQVAATIGSQLRATDLCARLGGDEFVILLSATGEAAAQSVLGRVFDALTALLAERWDAGVTLGAVAFTSPPENARQAVQLADALMYAGKAQGRGRMTLRVWPESAADEG